MDPPGDLLVQEPYDDASGFALSVSSNSSSCSSSEEEEESIDDGTSHSGEVLLHEPNKEGYFGIEEEIVVVPQEDDAGLNTTAAAAASSLDGEGDVDGGTRRSDPALLAPSLMDGGDYDDPRKDNVAMMFMSIFGSIDDGQPPAQPETTHAGNTDDDDDDDEEVEEGESASTKSGMYLNIELPSL
jgi:hypothetical protein